MVDQVLLVPVEGLVLGSSGKNDQSVHEVVGASVGSMRSIREVLGYVVFTRDKMAGGSIAERTIVTNRCSWWIVGEERAVERIVR